MLDLTDFLELHPGGKNSILKESGNDVTSMFHKNHQDSRELVKKIEHYCIGLYDDGFLYTFDACLIQTQPVNRIFKSFLEKMHSKGIKFLLIFRIIRLY